MKRTLCCLAAAAAMLSAGQDAYAQGCVLIREAAPVIGSASSTYLRPGEWQMNVSFRDSTADRHYSLGVEQVQRQILGSNVVNQQRQTLLDLNHAVTNRFSFSVSVPIVSASWSIPSPVPTATTAGGPRATQRGDGIGDVSAMGRYWLFDPAAHAHRNLSIGLGVKAPTGPSDETDTFVDIRGLNSAAKAIDQSVQPGDGGWGAQIELQGFTTVGPTFVFGSVNYLANPRDTNGTPSILVGLGVPSADPLRNVNSVPDQYVMRVGVGAPVWRNFGASVAFRMEGVPRYDLIGRSDGFRRPGQERYIEPALTYTVGRSTLQFSLPIGVYRYRAPDPYTGANGDATFPDYVAFASYSYRFGKTSHQATPTMPAPGSRQDG